MLGCCQYFALRRRLVIVQRQLHPLVELSNEVGRSRRRETSKSLSRAISGAAVGFSAECAGLQDGVEIARSRIHRHRAARTRFCPVNGWPLKRPASILLLPQSFCRVCEVCRISASPLPPLV